jgi:hypothetical protein
MDWFINLEEDEQNFLKRFILSSGSLKDLARHYNVSYRTVRLRLDRVIEKIQVNENNKDSFEANIMKMVIEEQISFDAAKEIIEVYRKEKEK